MIRNLSNVSNRKELLYNETDEDYRLGFYTNFLDTNDYNKMRNILIDHLFKPPGKTRSNCKYGHTSIGWHMYFVPHWNFDLTDNDFFSCYIMSKIRNLHSWTNDFQIKRIYCSIQVSGQSGNWHVDDSDLDAITFTLYCNIDTDYLYSEYSDRDRSIYDIYKSILPDSNKNSSSNNLKSINDNDDDGYFHIKYPNKPIQFFKTTDNTALSFNSTLIHLGDCPQYNSKSTRCVVAYKLTHK